MYEVHDSYCNVANDTIYLEQLTIVAIVGVIGY